MNQLDKVVEVTGLSASTSVASHTTLLPHPALLLHLANMHSCMPALSTTKTMLVDAELVALSYGIVNFAQSAYHSSSQVAVVHQGR